ncbi:MAG: mannose-1-phosphate guanylyltransferase [Candidatus Krumholzibacteria bacterium]|nr:mannose-1-phosphate guanylyltransferase [Candidatus Krumholzibacteria bacterium]
MYAAILAGGKGKRFWPFSRASRPKQFLDITGEGSMLSVTFNRIAGFIEPERIFLLTIEEQLPLVREELPELPDENIFTEPVGRNTAPSLAVAAAMVRHRGGDEPVLCCPADHLIRNTDTFRRLVLSAGEIASEHDVLITFGITPDRPSTGYGYIEAGSRIDGKGGDIFYEVLKFHEKPDSRRAENYLGSGRFYWNSGIFLWRPSVYISAWERYLPEGQAPLDRISDSLDGKDQTVVVKTEYPRMPSISVDYGILEKANNVLVAPADLGWNDVGSWDALYDVLPEDDSGNIVSGGMELVDSRGNLFFNPGGVTAAVGVEDLIVVVNGNIVLVCKRGQSQRVREVIESLEKKGATDLF